MFRYFVVVIAKKEGLLWTAGLRLIVKSYQGCSHIDFRSVPPPWYICNLCHAYLSFFLFWNCSLWFRTGVRTYCGGAFLGGSSLQLRFYQFLLTWITVWIFEDFSLFCFLIAFSHESVCNWERNNNKVPIDYKKMVKKISIWPAVPTKFLRDRLPFDTFCRPLWSWKLHKKG